MPIQYNLFDDVNYNKKVNTSYSKQEDNQENNLKDLEKLLNLAYYTFPSPRVNDLMNENNVAPLYSYIKREIIRKEVTSKNVRELLSEGDSDVYYKTLLFLYMTKRYNFLWPLDEEETAKIISYIFFYNAKPDKNFYTVFKPIHFIISTGKHLRGIDLESKALSPEKVVSKLPDQFFQPTFKKYDLAFAAIYLLFFKDNINLKKTLFAKIAAKEISKTTFNKEFFLISTLKEIEKYEDYLLVFEENVHKKIKKLCIDSASKKTKLFLTAFQNEILDFMIDKKQFEELKTFVENAFSNPSLTSTPNSKDENHYENFYFSISYDHKLEIDFSLKWKYKRNKIESLKDKLKRLKDKLTAQILNDTKAFNSYVSEVYDTLILAATIESLASIFSTSMYSQDILDLIDFLKKQESEERMHSKVEFEIEILKSIIAKFTIDKVSSFIERAIRSREEIYNLTTQEEVIERFVHDFKTFLIKDFFYFRPSNRAKEYLKSLTEKSFKSFKDRPYYEDLPDSISSKLEALNNSPREDEAIALIKELFRPGKKRIFLANFVLLLSDVIYYLKKNNLFTKNIKKILQQKTLPIGYVLITNELYPSRHLEATKFLDSLKQITLLSFMLKDTFEIFSNLRYNIPLNFLFKKKYIEDAIQLPHETTIEILFSNLYSLILPDISEDYLIYLP